MRHAAFGGQSLMALLGDARFRFGKRRKSLILSCAAGVLRQKGPWFVPHLFFCCTVALSTISMAVLFIS